MADVPEARDAPPVDSGKGAGASERVDPTVLALYQMAVEMADRVSSRRGLANTFFLTINSALLTVAGLAPDWTSRHQSTFGALVLALAGLILSGAWWTLLRSYRQLNQAKFHVINTIEERFPVTPFMSEWQYLTGTRQRWQRYFELGRVERVVPLVYAAIYVAAFVRSLVG